MRRVDFEVPEGVTHNVVVGKYGDPGNPTQVPEQWSDGIHEALVWRRSDGTVRYLSVARIDKKPIHDWRSLQAIKNIIAGAEVEAIELYPAESRKVDSANRYVLWVYPPGVKAPWGFHERDVREGL